MPPRKQEQTSLIRVKTWGGLGYKMMTPKQFARKQAAETRARERRARNKKYTGGGKKKSGKKRKTFLGLYWE